MTPQKKALNLIDRFENYSFMDIDKRISSFSSAKQCALIAVDEIIEEMVEWAIIPRIDYWSEVRQEIENL